MFSVQAPNIVKVIDILRMSRCSKVRPRPYNLLTIFLNMMHTIFTLQMHFYFCVYLRFILQ